MLNPLTRRARVWLATLFLATVCAVTVTDIEPVEAAPQAPAGATRYLTLGDSTTHGMSADWTWRYRFWEMLRAQGREPEMVGNREDTADPAATNVKTVDYADPRFPRWHAGSGGMKIAEMRYDVETLVRETQPDVVVVLLGLNDILQGGTGLAVAQRLDAMLLEIRRGKPGTDIILVHQPATWYVQNVDLNRRIDSLAAARQWASSKIAVAVAPTNYRVAQDTWDNFHPNAVGEVKIAHAVVAAAARLGHASSPGALPALPAAGPPRDVLNFRLATSTGRAHLAWANQRGVTGAVVYVRETGSAGAWVEARVDGDRVPISSLRSGRSYDFVVRPRRGHAVSAWAHSATGSVVIA